MVCGQPFVSIDSLKHELETKADSEECIDVLLQLSNRHLYNHPQKSLLYGKQALKLSEKYGRNDLLGQVYYQIGSAYWSIGDLPQSLDQLQLAMQHSSPEIQPALQCMIYMRIGSIYSASNDNLLSIHYSKKAIPLFEQTDDYFIRFAIYNNIGKAFLDIKYLDSAAYYFDKSYELRDEVPVRHLAILLFNMADLQYQTGNIEESLKIMSRTDSIAKVYEDIRSQIWVARLRAEIALNQGEFQKSYDHIRFAVDKAFDTQVKELIATTQATYSRVLEALGNNEEAFKALKISKNYYDSIRTTQAKNKLELYNFNESEKEKDELRKQNELSELKAANQQLVTIATTVFSLFMVVYVITSYRRHRMIEDQNKRLKEKNELIEKQKKQLDDLSSFKTKVMGIMAHDVRAPIQTIYGIIDILNQQLMSPDELKVFLPKMNTQLSQVNLMLNNIMEWSRAGMSENSVRPDNVSIFEVVKKCIEEQKFNVENKRLKIANSVPEDLMAFADPRMITVVVRNLLYNAIKYSHHGGMIVFQGEPKEKICEFWITDEGQGMSEETVNKLFSYETEPEPGTNKEIGSGFGLIVCKDFVEMNKGRITVQSTEGLGSTFTIQLPAS